MSDSPLHTKTPFKPGGTGHFLQGCVLGKVDNHEKDRLGRWTCTNLHGKDGKISIYAAYQTPISVSNTSNITFHTQQKVIYEKEKKNEEEVVNDKTPRRRFKRDFSKAVQDKLNQGHEIIIFADFNEDQHGKDSIINLLTEELNLIDVWSDQHSDETEPATYARGVKRLDYCLTTRKVARAVKMIQYTNFSEIANSDHRGILLDLDEKIIFEKKPATEYHERQLFSNDRKQIQEYLLQVQKHLISNNAFHILDELTASAEFQGDRLEKLDNIVTDAAISAERKLRTRQRPWWSTKINKVRYKLRLLRNHHRRLKQGFKHSACIQLQLKNNEIEATLEDSLSKSSTQLQIVKDELKDLIKSAREIREQEQTERHDYLNRNGMKSQAEINKLIRQKERLADAFQQVKSIRAPLETQALNRIDVPTQWTELQTLNLDAMCDPKSATQWTTITDPQEIEKYLILRNQKHFHQAHGTPLTDKSWTDLLDWAATSATAQDITAGTYGTQHLPETHAAVLDACRKRQAEPLIDYHLTTDSFRNKIKVWRETTATSPSGRHLGHYRALVTRLDMTAEDKMREKLQAIQDSVIVLITSIINYTTKHRYSLKRWQRIESTMIPKDVGSFKIHRLRVIHIFEADYNLLLGSKWREVIYKLENTTILHNDQHGSRPGRSATALPLQEELCYDISRCSRTALINFDNDATACYDRVVAELASLAGLRHGVHQNLIAVNTRTLQEARYYIRSKYRKNEMFYQHQPTYPIYGTGQGCANSPTVWCTVSSVLFEAHNATSHGAQFTSPDLTEATSFTMVGFVDDSMGRVNDFTARPQPTAFQLTGKIQHDAQQWHDILWFSGGKLELAKCSYHFVAWNFKESGEPVPVEHPNFSNISLWTPDNQVISIKRKSVFDPHKTLGHYKSPTSTLKVQLQKTQEKANNVANALYQSNIPSDLMWTMYNSVYLSSVAYVLLQSNFNKKQLDKAQTKSMRQIMAKCGYNRNSRKEVMYGPTYLGGAGFIPWSTLQGEGQVLNFLQHWRSESKTSSLLRISLAWAQFQAGMEKSILLEVDRPLPNVEAKWIGSLRNFLAEAEATLEVDNTFCYPPQRQNDRHIMDIIYESGRFTAKEQKHVNYCRLYLQVTTISDIANLQGNRLQEGAFEGDREKLLSTPKELQAVQARPDYKSWRCWVRFIRLISSRSGKLRQPLGKWLAPGPQLKQRWPSYYNAITNQYHIRNDEGNWTQWTNNEVKELSSFAPTAQDFPRARNGRNWASPIIADDTPPSFMQFIHDNDPQQLFGYIELFHEPNIIMEKLKAADETIIVSDGSSRFKAMAQGWAVAVQPGEILAEGAGSAFGQPTSHRAEGHGLHAATTFITLLQQYTKQKLHNCIFKCDNAGLINTIQQNLEYNQIFLNQFLKPDRDQVDSILANLHQIPEHQVEHVSGHQDEQEKDLDLSEELNVRADALAGWYDLHHPRRHPKSTVSPISKALLHIRGRTISGNYRQHLREAVHGPDFRRTLCEHHHWGDAEATAVDWSQFAATNQHLKRLRVWKAKFINDMLPTVRRSASVSYNRPPCDVCAVTDTWQHHLRCPIQSRRTASRQFLRRLATFLEEQDTSPVLFQAITRSLKAWFHNQIIEPEFQSDIQLAQSELGWYPFLKGLWHFQWAHHQQQYLQTQQRDTKSHNGRTWMQAVQIFILEGMHQLWVDFTSSVHRPSDGLSALHHRLSTQIQQLQADHAQLCPTHDLRFHLSEEQIVTATENRLQNWLNIYEDMVRLQIRIRRKANTLNQSLVTDFFRPSTG